MKNIIFILAFIYSQIGHSVENKSVDEQENIKFSTRLFELSPKEVLAPFLKGKISLPEADVKIRNAIIQYKDILFYLISIYKEPNAIQIFKEIIEIYPENIETKNANKRSLLAVAAYYGALDIVKFLLEKGAHIEAVDNKGDTPLLLAVQEKHVSIVEFFLQKGANIAHKNFQNRTAIVEAARAGSLEEIKILLEEGSLLEKSMLYFAIKNNNVDICEYLLKSMSISSEDFILSIRSHNENILAMLIAHGAGQYINDRIGETYPLIVACQINDPSIVRVLLEHGADPNLKEFGDSTPLIIAASKHSPAIVRDLLEKGADARKKGSIGQTALKAARRQDGSSSSENAAECVRLLKENLHNTRFQFFKK